MSHFSLKTFSTNTPVPLVIDSFNVSKHNSSRGFCLLNALQLHAFTTALDTTIDAFC
jgi:hypothetical protein